MKKKAVKKPSGKRSVPRRARAAAIRKTIDPGWSWDDRIPLIQGRQVGDTIYVSGQVALDASGSLVGAGDVAAQTRQCLDNVRAVLAAAGARIEDVVKITSYITDAAKFGDLLRERAAFFGASLPASTAVVVAALARPEFMVEVEAIAVRS